LVADLWVWDVLLQKLIKVGQVEVVFVHSPIELRAEEKVVPA